MKKFLGFLSAILISASAWAGQDIPTSFQSSALGSTLNFLDDTQLIWGTGTDFACEYDTAQTPDSEWCGVGSDSRVLILGEKADINSDLAIAQKTNPTLHIHAADAATTTKWIELSHDGTNGIVDVGLGAVSIPDGLTTAGLATWTGGTAITAGSYQVGRDADGTNQLHFNVPTGATMEWSINDVAEATLSATVANFQNNTITTSGTLTNTGTNDIGWSIVNVANQACNTTCTNACVFGINTAAIGNLLPCTDATADSCLCAGAN